MKSRVLPLQGIDEDLKFYLEHEIMHVEGMLVLLCHKETPFKRMVECSYNHQTLSISDTKILETNVTSWAQQYSVKNKIWSFTTIYPQIGLAFKKNHSYDNHFYVSFNTYLSQLATHFTLSMSIRFDLPPLSNSLAM